MSRIKGLFLTVFLFIVSFLLISQLITKNSDALTINPAIDISKLKVSPKIISCIIVSNKVDEKVNNFEKNKNKHIEVYTKLQDRLEQMIEKWNNWGYDTSKLEKDMTELDKLIKEYEEDFSDFKSKLEDLKDLCGDDEYSTKLAEQRELLKEMRKDIVDLRILYQTVIRPHIVMLKSQNIE